MELESQADTQTENPNDNDQDSPSEKKASKSEIDQKTDNNNGKSEMTLEESSQVSSESEQESEENENDKLKKTIKRMNFKENDTLSVQFIPAQSNDNEIIYGTKQFQVMYRFLYTVYERILKAREISTHFEKNENTDKLSEEEKEAIS